MPWPHHDLFLTSSADILEPSPNSDMLCFVEDPTFGYEDFTRRGTQAPPTFRAQVGSPHWSYYCFTNKQRWVVCVVRDLGTFSPSGFHEGSGRPWM